MQVQTVSYQNSPNFGAVYAGARFSKTQRQVADQIMKVFKKNAENGISIEEKYKRRGLDFILDSDRNGLVSLTGYSTLRIKGTGVDRKAFHSSGDGILIGRYDKKHPFKVSDIDEKIKERNRETFGFALPTILLVAAIVASPFVFKSVKNKIENVKPLVENTDSIAQKTKAVLSDSTKVLKVFKK